MSSSLSYIRNRDEGKKPKPPIEREWNYVLLNGRPDSNESGNLDPNPVTSAHVENSIESDDNVT